MAGFVNYGGDGRTYDLLLLSFLGPFVRVRVRVRGVEVPPHMEDNLTPGCSLQGKGGGALHITAQVQGYN